MDRIDEILFLYEDDVVEMADGGRIGFAEGKRVDTRKAKIVDTHILERKSPTTPALYKVEISYVDPKLLKQEGYDAPRSSNSNIQSPNKKRFRIRLRIGYG